MKKLRFIIPIIILSLIFTCKYETYWDTADIIGFDPCTAVDSLNRGYIIITMESKDTLVTYNLPSNIFSFPKSYFVNYKSDCLFPDSARYDYRIKIKYSFKQRGLDHICFGDIFLGVFYEYTKNRQITLQSARKY
jgi:hypothetical protein